MDWERYFDRALQFHREAAAKLTWQVKEELLRDSANALTEYAALATGPEDTACQRWDEMVGVCMKAGGEEPS